MKSNEFGKLNSNLMSSELVSSVAHETKRAADETKKLLEKKDDGA